MALPTSNFPHLQLQCRNPTGGFMALKINKVEVWAGDLRDVPGGLASVLERLSEAGAKLQCVIARRRDDQIGAGKVFVTPISGSKVQQAASAVGLQPANIGTLRVEGSDAAGLGARMMRAIGDAGINVRGVSAAVIGGKFVAYIGLDSDADATAAAAALRGLST